MTIALATNKGQLLQREDEEIKTLALNKVGSVLAQEVPKTQLSHAPQALAVF